MKKTIVVLFISVISAALLGCSQPDHDDQAHGAHGHDHGPDGHSHASETPGAAAETVTVTPTPGQKVEVSQGGTEFAPPIPVSAIPDGGWACVVENRVHYATADKGEGVCVVCGTKLIQVSADGSGQETDQS